MTSEAIIARYYAAFNQQNIPMLLELLTEDVQHAINQGSVEIGKAKFAVFMQHMNHCYREKAEDMLIMVNQDGTRGAAEFIISGTYIAKDGNFPEATGQTYRLACGAFFALREHKISRVTNYYNLPEWLRQINCPS